MVRETLKYYWRKRTSPESQEQALNDKHKQQAVPQDLFEAEALKGASLMTEQEFAETTQLLDQQIDQRAASKSSKLISPFFLKMVAGILLILISFFWIYQFSGKDHEELLAEYFEPFPNVLISVTRGHDQANELARAMFFYESGQYEQSANDLENYLQLPDARPEAQLYLGIAYLAIHHPGKSLISFSEVYQSPVIEIREAAYWFSSLAYLALDDEQRAREMAQEVIGFEGFYQKRAEALLRAI